MVLNITARIKHQPKCPMSQADMRLVKSLTIWTNKGHRGQEMYKHSRHLLGHKNHLNLVVNRQLSGRIMDTMRLEKTSANWVTTVSVHKHANAKAVPDGQKDESSNATTGPQDMSPSLISAVGSKHVNWRWRSIKLQFNFQKKVLISVTFPVCG